MNEQTIIRQQQVTEKEARLRDTFIDIMKGAGINVNTDPEKANAAIRKYYAGADIKDGIFQHPDAIQAMMAQSPVFVSNALLAVDGITQEKATPEQWLKMIGKFGGLKAAEDRWTGLSGWLRSCQEKTLTKGQIVDYLCENIIRVEDVLYADTKNFNIDTVKESREFEDMVLEYTEYDKEDQPYIDKQRFFDEAKKDDDFYDAFSVDYWGETIDIDDPVAAARYLGLVEGREVNETRLRYTTDGLTDKKEIALVVPSIEQYKPEDLIHFGDAGDGKKIRTEISAETSRNLKAGRTSVIDIIKADKTLKKQINSKNSFSL